MVRKFCVCGRRTKVIVVHGEHVCSQCHYEATGERPPKIVYLRHGKPHRIKRRTRSHIREELIFENLKNKIKGK